MDIKKLGDEVNKVNDEISDCIIKIKSENFAIDLQRHFIEQGRTDSNNEEKILKSREIIDTLSNRLTTLNAKRDNLIDEIHKLSPDEKIPDAYYHPKERKRQNRSVNYAIGIVFWIVVLMIFLKACE